MISSEEVGTILARLVITDEEFLQTLLLVAQNAESSLLTGDYEKLAAWARLMRILRGSIANNIKPNSNN